MFGNIEDDRGNAQRRHERLSGCLSTEPPIYFLAVGVDDNYSEKKSTGHNHKESIIKLLFLAAKTRTEGIRQIDEYI